MDDFREESRPYTRAPFPLKEPLPLFEDLAMTKNVSARLILETWVLVQLGWSESGFVDVASHDIEDMPKVGKKSFGKMYLGSNYTRRWRELVSDPARQAVLGLQITKVQKKGAESVWRVTRVSKTTPTTSTP